MSYFFKILVNFCTVQSSTMLIDGFCKLIYCKKYLEFIQENEVCDTLIALLSPPQEGGPFIHRLGYAWLFLKKIAVKFHLTHSRLQFQELAILLSFFLSFWPILRWIWVGGFCLFVCWFVLHFSNPKHLSELSSHLLATKSLHVLNRSITILFPTSIDWELFKRYVFL